jgi:hypothetical protein
VFEINLFPDTITVYPDPALHVKYFWSQNVYGDDPFTLDVVEPSIPFNLAVMLYNDGAGDAKDVRIVSSQPEIIENEKGLLVDFEIIQSQVNYQAVEPSLAVSIGEIKSFTASVARWDLVCSLQGEFKDYNATMEYVTPLGDERLSVVESLSIHPLVHVVRDESNEDNVPDFLTDDVDGDFVPDTLHSSMGNSLHNVTAVLPANVTQGDPFVGDNNATVVPITIPVGLSGPIYVRMTDPATSSQTLTRVVRQDAANSTLPVENFWRTHRIRRVADSSGNVVDEDGTVEDWLHIFDFGSAGTYWLVFDDLAIVEGLTALQATEDSITVSNSL